MKALQKKSLFVKTQMFQVIDYYVAIGTINSYIDKMEEHHWQNYMHRLLPVCQNRKFKIEEEPKNTYCMLEISSTLLLLPCFHLQMSLSSMLQ